jgi:MoaA/NifB/PqqE/SkfB family radical SAM enzyme
MTATMTDATLCNRGIRVSFLWLEITAKCQLACEHCYADSGPTNSHGSMTSADWMLVIQDAAELGVEMVQFIGGEPTLHPKFNALLRHALASGLSVEVYTNLVRLTPEQWALFELPGVQLATSYYSDDATEHDSITRRHKSHHRTLEGITEAMRRDIPLRVGLIRTRNGQRIDKACQQLAELGVTDIKIDHLRQVGRGIRDRKASMDQLCGNCASDVLAVSPNGDVWPCVFARWMSIGNVRDVGGLRGVLTSAAPGAARDELRREFESRRQNTQPVACKPHGTCGPCSPTCVP